MAVPNPRAASRVPAIACPLAASDPFSEAIETFPLEIRFVGRFHLSAPWGLSVPEGTAVICAVVEGNCTAIADTAPNESRATSGDVLFLSPGAEHRLGDAMQTPAAPLDTWVAARRADDPLALDWGGAGARTRLIGGVLRFDDPAMHPFHWGLPPVIHLDRETVDRSLHLHRLVELLDVELSADWPGRSSVVKRLVEIIFVETARLGLAVDSREISLRHLLHVDLGPALALMHRQPEKPWTVAELAERVAMSRSAFAAEFVRVYGRPPMAYLRQRRMELAGRLLRDSSLGLKEVALRVGYDSASAFNSAFCRAWGVAPGRFRNGRSRQETQMNVAED
ncbi:MAG: AraC family transcriptional regulator [Pirellulales bacterium]|nr:AraC family transcriptional regulator [Pirellulales bacterium]